MNRRSFLKSMLGVLPVLVFVGPSQLIASTTTAQSNKGCANCPEQGRELFCTGRAHCVYEIQQGALVMVDANGRLREAYPLPNQTIVGQVLRQDQDGWVDLTFR